MGILAEYRLFERIAIMKIAFWVTLFWSSRGVKLKIFNFYLFEPQFTSSFIPVWNHDHLSYTREIYGAIHTLQILYLPSQLVTRERFSHESRKYRRNYGPWKYLPQISEKKLFCIKKDSPYPLYPKGFRKFLEEKILFLTSPHINRTTKKFPLVAKIHAFHLTWWNQDGVAGGFEESSREFGRDKGKFLLAFRR